MLREDRDQHAVDGPSEAEVRDALESVKRLTSDVFPATRAEYVEAEDGEIAGERYIEVIVSDAGAMDDIVARHDAWHRRVAQLPADVKRRFRLSIDVQPQ